jgi:hypothetical protein
MQVPAALHPLLGSFALEISSAMWWCVVDEYLEGTAASSAIPVAEQLESLAAVSESDQALSEALVEVGCYYWPAPGTSQREWLLAVAARLRERALRESGLRQRRPPKCSNSKKAAK